MSGETLSILHSRNGDEDVKVSNIANILCTYYCEISSEVSNIANILLLDIKL